MNSYEEANWMGTTDPSRAPQNDFGFNEVDDFLTQTLNSLQDLDIPVGEPPINPYGHPQQYQQQGYAPQVRGHKKQPSGTAIFGFVQHNKTLSIPSIGVGAPGSYEKKPTMSRQIVEPQQIFSEEHNQQIKQEPVLFQTPHDFHMVQQYDNVQMYSQQHHVYPPPPPQQQQQQHPMGHQVPVRAADDYIVTNKTPYGYKFPPEPQMNPHHHQHPHMPHQHPMYQPHAMAPPHPLPPPHAQGSPQKTVQVPVEYLQKLTKMIKDSNGVDMESFLNYDFDTLEREAQQNHENGSPRRAPSEISPVLNAYEHSSQSSHSREPSPEHLDLKPSPMKDHLNVIPSSPPKQAKFIHSAISFGLEVKSEDKEDKACPATPSPTLKSQAKFISSPVKADLNWTPVVIAKGEKTGAPVIKKKVHDKVSTLPPGEIDQYVIGPREDKTFICNYNGCGKLFTRRYNVRSHVQTHLSDRPFTCQVPGCHKAFVRQHDLTRHKKIHQDLAFQCECGKKFSRHDALFRHRARNICSGGLDADEVARIEMRQAQTSVQKKRIKDRPSIRVANDTVAKRLEFDLLAKQKKRVSQSQSTPASPQSRKVSGASTVDAFDEDEEGEEEEEHFHVGPLRSQQREVTPTPHTGLGLMQDFTSGNLQLSDDEDNVFLNDLNFDDFDLAHAAHDENHDADL